MNSRSQRGYEKSDYRPSKQEQVWEFLLRIFLRLEWISNRNDRMNMEEINPEKIVRILNPNNNQVQKNLNLPHIQKQPMKNHLHLLLLNLHPNVKQTNLQPMNDQYRHLLKRYSLINSNWCHSFRSSHPILHQKLDHRCKCTIQVNEHVYVNNKIHHHKHDCLINLLCLSQTRTIEHCFFFFFFLILHNSFRWVRESFDCSVTHWMHQVEKNIKMFCFISKNYLLLHHRMVRSWGNLVWM